MFTYKGNFGVRRNNTNFTGERSPYIAIDIDIDEKAAGLSKYSLTEEQRVKASSDIDKLIDELSEGRRDFFFCKRTSSGCGLHIIIKMEGVPEGKFDYYEKEIFSRFAVVLKKIEGLGLLNYSYNIDNAMLSKSQALHINPDPKVIYTPARLTHASLYKPTIEYGDEPTGDKEQKVYPGRIPHEVDRKMFARFERFCLKNGIRMSYDQIYRLSLIFLELWPEATVRQYMDGCKGFNEERARQKHESSTKFFITEYRNIKKALGKTYEGKKITVDSLHYIMNEYGYHYSPDLELRFTGYLSSVKERIYSTFTNHDEILLEAPTGSGKTKMLFEYLKEQARLYPTKNFVIALPYISMAQQFCSENSDDEFEIKLLTGDKTEHFNTMVELPDEQESQTLHPVFKLDPLNFEGNGVKVPLPTVTIVKHKTEQKKADKNDEVTGAVPLFEVPKKQAEKIKRRNLFCTTFDSACRIKSIHTLVIDEAHDIVKQLDFRTEAIESMAMVRCKKRILITATPAVLLPETEDYHYVKCIKEDSIKPALIVERVQGSLIAAAKDNIIKQASSLTFFNNKEKCEILRDELLVEGVVAHLYNRDTRGEPHQEILKKEGELSKHGIATSYISEGINVLNETLERINIIGDYDLDNIRQASARPRIANPEIRLILKDTEYKPGTWLFLPVRQYIRELSRLMQLANRLTVLRSSLKLRNDNGYNLFAGFEDDEPYIYWDDMMSQYFVRTNKVKGKIAESHKHWLYHKKRELWEERLGEHFTLMGNIATNNAVEDDKRKAKPIEAFVGAGHDLILAFNAHKKKSKDKRRKKERYTPEMLAWSRANNHVELTSDWEKWTKRYLKMWEYKAVDYSIIQSGQKFCYWQRRADMLVSVNEPVANEYDNAKEVNIADRNKAIVNYLLSLDFTQRDITKPELYVMIFEHLRIHGLKALKLSERSLFSSLKNTIAITVRRKKSTGARYVKSVVDLRNMPAFSSGKVEQLQKDAATVERFKDFA